ncbi:hypothetical protein ACO0LO_01735 [Undibacterium sp. TJN25]|uniref:hypothetical protein n=1 Tax=Undibacterium sp. TJN25 TaxID=3413056 RepID=UPI003BEFD4B5
MASIGDVLSVAAALVSAVGGFFSARAAAQSAHSARETQQAAADAERRSMLRLVALTAAETIVEAGAIEARGNDLKKAYRALYTHAGQYGSASHKAHEGVVDSQMKTSVDKSDHAALFTGAITKLASAPPEEIDRVQLSLSSALTELRAIRLDLERKNAIIQDDIAPYRNRAILGK